MEKEEIQKLLIKDFKYWEVMLHSNQCYLGRCVLWCKREDVNDFFDMSKEEKEEFWQIAKQLRDILRDLWQPDLMNYSSLANVTPHLHIHVIPRYKEKRFIGDQEFIDDRWGKNPTPKNDNFQISEDTMEKIKTLIRNKF